jgi:hypothetical protein
LVDAAGGYDPVNCVTTFPRDNTFYYGQADFVTRVSRAHTVWFDTLAASQYVPPIVEPGPSELPAGTQVVLAFRGATAMNSMTPNAKAWTDATYFDSYGDGYTGPQLGVFNSMWPPLAFTPLYFNIPPNSTNKTWKSSITQLNGAQFFQARISFLGNPETLLTPELSALGFAYFR